MNQPRYPHIHVNIDLSGQDGATLVIIAKVEKAMKAARIPQQMIDTFVSEVKAASNYIDQLKVVGRYVDFNGGDYN